MKNTDLNKYDIYDSPQEEKPIESQPLDLWAKKYESSQYLPFSLHPFTKYRYGIVEIVCPTETFRDKDWKGRPIPFFIKSLPSHDLIYDAGGPMKFSIIPYMERTSLVLPGYCLNTSDELKDLRLGKDGWSLHITNRGKSIRVLAALEKFHRQEKRKRRCFINKDVFYKCIPYLEDQMESYDRLHMIHGLTPPTKDRHILPLMIRRKNLRIDTKTAASLIGISKNHYELIESGKKLPTMTMVIKLAKIHDVDIEVMMTEFNHNIRYSSEELSHVKLFGIDKEKKL